MNHFNLTLSFEQQLCSFQVEYGGALTLYANAVKDSVSLGGATLKGSALFGATYNVSQPGNRRRRPIIRKRQNIPAAYPEGMWGLAFSSINALGAPTLLDTLTQHNHMPNVFALCVQPIGGVMNIAGHEPPIWGAGWNYTPISSRNGFWQPEFLDVRINGQSLGFPSHTYNTPGIIDSGTPFTTLPLGPFVALKSMLRANCSANPVVGVCGVPENSTIFDNGNCFAMTAAQRAAYPTLGFLLSGLSLTLESSFYLLDSLCQGPGQFGLGLVSDPNFTVLGANTLLKYATLFDAENMKVGFSDMRGLPCPK